MPARGTRPGTGTLFACPIPTNSHRTRHRKANVMQPHDAPQSASVTDPAPAPRRPRARRIFAACVLLSLAVLAACAAWLSAPRTSHLVRTVVRVPADSSFLQLPVRQAPDLSSH